MQIFLNVPRYTLPPGRPMTLPDPPGHAPEDVLVNVYPQDPLVDRGKAVVIAFPRDEIEAEGSKLSNRWFVTQNTRSPHLIHPDEEGNFLFAPGTPQFSQVNAHVHATRAVHMVERFRGKELPWRFGDRRRHHVAVHVNYDRTGDSQTAFGPRTINLDTYTSRSLGKEVRDADCADTIAHEVGHDILEGLRPGNEGSDPECGSFSESFGDIVALFYAMEFDQNRERALSQTQGNLRRQNILAKLFEEDGKSTRLKQNPNARGGFFVRSALNTAQYASPKEEDYEIHRASQPYTGAFYDVLVGLYERQLQKGKAPDSALTSARDQLGAVWGRSLDFLPRKNIRFAQGLRALLKADEEMKAGLGPLIRRSFAERGILPAAG